MSQLEQERADKAVIDLCRSLVDRADAREHHPHKLPELDQKIDDELGHAAQATLHIDRGESRQWTEAQANFKAANSAKERDQVVAKLQGMLTKAGKRIAAHKAIIGVVGATAVAAIPLLDPVAVNSVGTPGWVNRGPDGSSTLYYDENGNGLPEHLQHFDPTGSAISPDTHMDAWDKISEGAKAIWDNIDFSSMF